MRDFGTPQISHNSIKKMPTKCTRFFFCKTFLATIYTRTNIASCNCFGIVCRFRYHRTRRHRSPPSNATSEYLSTGHCPTNNVTCNIIMRILSQIHRKQRIEWNDELTRNQTLRLSNTFVKKITPNETYENTKPTDFTENSERQHSWRHHRYTTGTQNQFFDSKSSRLFPRRSYFLVVDIYHLKIMISPCFTYPVSKFSGGLHADGTASGVRLLSSI